jgi:excisionase family DNA binding protein
VSVERLVDAAAVAELLGVPVSWVREQTRSGFLPHVQLGRYVRYRLSVVEVWIAEQSKAGQARARGGVPATRARLRQARHE